jgi:hypothetical protein
MMGALEAGNCVLLFDISTVYIFAVMQVTGLCSPAARNATKPD